MKIILDDPLCIQELGKRAMQQDSVVPAFGEAQSTDRHFMVGEGPLADVYVHKASLTLHNSGITVRYAGKCRVFQIRPGYDRPVYASEIVPDQSSGEGYEDIFTRRENVVELSDVQTGDWFLAFTDGMCEYLQEEDIVSIMTRPDWTAEHKKDALLDYTSENEDNHSAYILHVRAIDEDSEDQTPVAEDEKKTEEQQAPTTSQKLNPVNIETDLQDTDIDVSQNGFEISARTVLIVLSVVYAIMLIIGFLVGMFG